MGTVPRGPAWRLGSAPMAVVMWLGYTVDSLQSKYPSRAHSQRSSVVPGSTNCAACGAVRPIYWEKKHACGWTRTVEGAERASLGRRGGEAGKGLRDDGWGPSGPATWASSAVPCSAAAGDPWPAVSSLASATFWGPEGGWRRAHQEGMAHSGRFRGGLAEEGVPFMELGKRRALV